MNGKYKISRINNDRKCECENEGGSHEEGVDEGDGREYGDRDYHGSTKPMQVLSMGLPHTGPGHVSEPL